MKNVYTLLVAGLLVLTACEKELGYEPFIEMDQYTGCKQIGLKGAQDVDPSQDCIQYSYDGDSLLSIKHVNAGFNCCPERLMVEMEQRGDTLFIREAEKEQLCDCNCLYDLDYAVHGIKPGTYVISVIEPYALAGTPRLIFSVNLRKEPVGSYCVERDYYPWGDY